MNVILLLCCDGVNDNAFRNVFLYHHVVCAQRRKLLRTILLLKAHEDLKMEIQNMFTHIFHTRMRYFVLLCVINL